MPQVHQPKGRSIRLFLCGDVMIGRGIDQVLPHPCDPALHEDYVRSAQDYVDLAEMQNGPIGRAVDPSYIWGAALEEMNRMRPDARIINLETSITRSEEYEDKGINYRISSENADCLKAAAIDCCILGNNHVLDWGHRGLIDTLATLEHLHIKTAGAGRNLAQAKVPAILDVTNNGRVLVFSYGLVTSGVPHSWGATTVDPGVNLLASLSEATALQIGEEIAHIRRPGDLIIVSLHWGPNWGYGIPNSQRNFAHTLINQGDVSVIHGHSSHHPKGIEVYHGRLILYGCGDFLNDYEGIRGYEDYRDDLVPMYFVDLEPAGTLGALKIIPLQIRKFQLVRPSEDDICWMQETLDRESRKLGVAIEMQSDGCFAVSWN